MNFGSIILNKIKEEKNRALENKPGEKFITTQYNEGGCHFQIKFKDVDKYGIVLDHIAVSRGTPILDLDILNKTLKEQAEKVQEKITYLLEDFKLIELDMMNKRAQLRSYPPHKKEDSRFYYEIVLDEGSKVHFLRYEYSTAQRRFEKITSQLTLETFERLIDDLAEVLCERT